MPNSYTNLLLASLLSISFYIVSKQSPGKVNRFLFSCIVFVHLFLFLLYKAADYFTGVGIDYATITQIKFGFRGAGIGDYVGHITLYLFVLVLSLSALGFFIFKSKLINRKKSRKLVLSAYFLLVFAFVCNPALINLYNLPTGTFIPSRASSEFASTEFYKYYKIPKLKPRSNEQKNLVLIYAESLEHAFFNEQVFPNLVPRLKSIEQQGISFTNMHMTQGTGGTIWAISASQCGLPLFLPNQAILTHGSEEFLGSAICLGDVLEDEGYHLAYYGGASLGFTGKGKFFKTHGFTEVYGKDELRLKLDDPDYLNFWGLYDDSLLDISFKRFLELSETKEKFGLFLLTIDAHTPGYSSKQCEQTFYQDGENTHLNAVACTDYLLSEFIQKIAESPYAEKTVIVIASDHVNWNAAPSIDLLKKAREGRKNIFMIIEPGKDHVKEVKTKATAFDIGTTILPFLGYDGEIGLGRNLIDINEEDEQEIAYIQTRLFNWKTEILKFWNQPKINKSLLVDVKNKTISIDGKRYKIPVIIQVTDELETALLFNVRRYVLAKYMKKLKSDQKLIMINPCKDIEISGDQISETGKTISNTGWCLMASTGKKVHFMQKIEEPVHFTVPELQKLLAIQDG